MDLKKIIKNKRNLLIGGVAIATLVTLTGCGKKDADIKVYDKENEVQQIINDAVIQVENVEDDVSNGTNNQDISVYDTDAKFSYNDLIVEKLRYGMTEEQVKDIMGEPDSIQDSNNDGDLYGDSVSYLYDDLQLAFYEHDGNMVLSLAATESSKYTFAKGLKVGDSKEKVISSFYRESTDEDELRGIYSIYSSDEPFGKYLYGHGLDDVIDGVKESGDVEYAYINYYNYDASRSDTTYMIEYNYAQPPYTSEYASNVDEMGTLVFDMDSSDVVTGIRWYYYPEVK